MFSSTHYQSRETGGFGNPAPHSPRRISPAHLTCTPNEDGLPLLFLPTTYQGDGCHFLQRHVNRRYQKQLKEKPTKKSQSFPRRCRRFESSRVGRTIANHQGPIGLFDHLRVSAGHRKSLGQ